MAYPLFVAAQAAYRRWVALKGPSSSLVGDTKVIVEKTAWYALEDAMYNLMRAANDGAVKYEGEVLAERRLQDEQWGGAEYDDSLTPADWMNIMEHHFDRLLEVAEGVSRRGESNTDLRALYRRRVLVLEALCRAARESHDRVQGAKRASSASAG